MPTPQAAGIASYAEYRKKGRNFNIAGFLSEIRSLLGSGEKATDYSGLSDRTKTE
jgi:hypothetical protein